MSQSATDTAAPGPYHLDDTRAVLNPAMAMLPRAVTDDFYQRLEQDLDGFAGHILIQQFEFSTPWGMWEMHPAGDEMVYLISGHTDLVLRTAEGERRLTLKDPGSYAVVPRGAWHTAEPQAPTRLFFITPGEGTQNLETPPV